MSLPHVGSCREFRSTVGRCSAALSLDAWTRVSVIGMFQRVVFCLLAFDLVVLMLRRGLGLQNALSVGLSRDPIMSVTASFRLKIHHASLD